MAVYQQPIITNTGKNLYSKVLTGVTELKFTGVKYGSGKVTTENQEELTTLIKYELDGIISSIQKDETNREAYVNVSLNNSTITSTVNICEIGLFAKDPDLGEILYAYTNAGNYGDPITSPTTSVNTWAYRFILGISNDINVTINTTEAKYDFDILSSSNSLQNINGDNQKVINESIDSNLIKLNKNQIYWIGSLTHVSNVYTVSLDKELELGLAIAFLSTNATTGNVSINYNGKGSVLVKKINGNNLNNIKANSIQTFRWNGTNFMQASGSVDDVTFTSDKLLTGYSANDSNGEKVPGTMPNRGEYQYAGGIGSAGDYFALNQMPYGYYPSSSNGLAPEIRYKMSDVASFLGITSNKILAGNTIAGVPGGIVNRGTPSVTLNAGGSYSLSAGYYSGGQIIANSLASQTPANATAAQILAGYSSWVNGVKIPGTATIESLGGTTLSSGTETITLTESESRMTIDLSSKGINPYIVWGSFTSGTYFINFRHNKTSNFTVICWDRYDSRYGVENSSTLSAIKIAEGDSNHKWSAGDYVVTWYAL